MVRWGFGSILHGGPIELFLVPASSPTSGLTKAVRIKESLLLIGNRSPCSISSEFPLVIWMVLYHNYVRHITRAGRSSEVERSLMVRWVVGSIIHGVDPLTYFSFQPVLHDWYNKGRGMCYPVCGMVHIKEPLLLAYVAAAGFLSHYQNGP